MKRFFLIGFLLLCGQFLDARSFPLRYSGELLNEVLERVAREYNIQLSYNSSIISNYRVSVNTTCHSERELLEVLLTNLPFKIKKVGEVFVITSLVDEQQQAEKAKHKLNTAFYGVVCDAITAEPLVGALINTNGSNTYTNTNGGFVLDNDQVKDTVVSHITFLGYSPTRVTLIRGVNNSVLLSPSYIPLREIMINAKVEDKYIYTPEQPDVLKVNRALGMFLPGTGNNSIYTLLSLLPGIKAAGEPSYISIRGSKDGESAIFFDGFRIFDISSTDLRIGVINPDMISSIDLYKGAPPVKYSNYTGGVAVIKPVSSKSFSLKNSLTNLMVSNFISIPIGDKSIVYASYRQSYSDLFAGENVNQTGNGNSAINNFILTPDYSFKEANLRYKYTSNDGFRLLISAFLSDDNFAYSLDNERLSLNANDKADQKAAALHLSKDMAIGSISLSGAFSSRDMEGENVKRVRGTLQKYRIENRIDESTAGAELNFNRLKDIDIIIGADIKLLGTKTEGLSKRESVPNIYSSIKYRYNWLDLQLGYSHQIYRGESYSRPSGYLSITPVQNFKISLSYNKTYQYSSIVPIVNDDKNSWFIWSLAGDDFPVKQSSVITSAINFSLIGVEGDLSIFRKRDEGAVQYTRVRNSLVLSEVVSSINGVEISLRKSIKGSNIFLGAGYYHTSVEKILNNKIDDYHPLEIKGGGVINLSPFYISFDYIFGEGDVVNLADGRGEDLTQRVYRRMDLSANYRFKIKHLSGGVGVSLLNVLDNDNYKYADIIPATGQGSAGQGAGNQSSVDNIFVKSLPFTPSFHLNIEF